MDKELDKRVSSFSWPSEKCFLYYLATHVFMFISLNVNLSSIARLGSSIIRSPLFQFIGALAN